MPRPKAERPTYSLTARAGRYYVQWWESGRACRLSCRTSDKTEAEQFLATFRAGREVTPAPEAPTVGSILDGYEADRSPKTHSAALAYSCAALRRHLARLPVALLTTETIDRYSADRRAEWKRSSAKKLSDGTLIRELGTLRAALAWAVRRQWIASAPHIDRPSAPAARDRWLTRHEADRLLAACVAPHVRLFITVALHTAARTSAILQLTWDRVDLASRRLDLGDARGNKKRARHLPINDALLTELRLAYQARTTAWVIEHNGAPVASVKNGVNAAARRAGLSGVTPHVFRHTAVTWLMQAGVPTGMIGAYAAMTAQMVERVYGHHAPGWMQPAADALSGVAVKEFPRQSGRDNGGENES